MIDFTCMARTAHFSDDKRYRYNLTRSWDHTRPGLNWVMLNPSLADGWKDDATIRRCVRFANSWGYGRISVYNLFALVATNPLNLTGAVSDIGSDNDSYLNGLSGATVLAWGSNGSRFPARVEDVIARLQHRNMTILFTLGKTTGGQPKHPLRLSAFTKLEAWS